MDTEPSARADAKLQTLAEQDEQFAEDMWRFRNPEKGGKKLTYAAILLEVPLRCGFTVSLSTLHNFYRWLKVHRDFQEKRRDIAQLKLELAKDPDISEEQIEKAGRVMFMADGLITKNPKVFAAMVQIGHDKVKLQQNDVKIALSKEVVEMDKRKLVMLEAKAAKADEAEKVMGNGKLTEEEKAARMKRIFRMG